MSKPACHNCGTSDNVLLRRIINAGGASMVAWRCTGCQTWTPSPAQWIKHETVKAIIGGRHTIDNIPIYEDYRIPCAICGAMGAQYHHWFPQVFKDHAEVSPEWGAWAGHGIELCQYHHDLWHDLVTPWMPGRGNSRQTRT
jgi:hypothetical protein